MATVPDKEENRKSEPRDPPWYISGLIAGIDASPTRKYLLTLIQRHTHSRKRFAWASQKALAREMGVDLRTVERAFRWAKKIGVVAVRRIRTGKHPADQHNEYCLNIERLKKLQRPLEHPTRMSGDAGQHPTPMSDDRNREHPTLVTPNTRQILLEHPTLVTE